jgi:predicted site-specific integrase-resolvase
MPSARKLAPGAFSRSGVDVVTITGPEMLLTTREAAEICRVKIDTVRKWVRRGHLERVGLDENGWPVYLAVDVAKAEYATRVRARRRVLPDRLCE